LMLFSLVFLACGQTKTSYQYAQLKQDTASTKKLIFDTTKIAILPIDTTNKWVFKDVSPLQLTDQDLHSIDTLLKDCLKIHNSKQDSTYEYSEYIDLKKYRRQYVPFVDSNGDKKVYVNCFCTPDVLKKFGYWKESLVEIKDGGNCFFHLTLNLTTNRYDQLFINGYA
jgi:hypothetical protein